MIESIRLMAIIRDVEPLYAVPIAETLVSEGITDIEVSLSDAEKGFGCIENIQKRFSPDEICLGAGTVTKKEEVDRLAAMKIPFFLRRATTTNWWLTACQRAWRFCLAS